MPALPLIAVFAGLALLAARCRIPKYEKYPGKIIYSKPYKIYMSECDYMNMT